MSDPSPLISGPSTLRPLLRLALPVLIEQLLSMLIGISDKWLTGNFLPGKEFLAAMTLVGYVYWLIFGMFAAVSIAATALVARLVGAGDKDGAQRAANQAFVLGGLLSAAAVALALLFGRDAIFAMGLEPNAAGQATRYLAIILPVVPAWMCSQVGIAVLRGAGDTVTGMVSMVFENCLNIVLGYCLLRGVGPFPKLGWIGLAIAADVSIASGAAVVLWQLVRGRLGLRLRWRLLKPDLAWIRRLMRIGIPGGFDTAASVVCQIWFLSIIARLGDVALSAHGIGITVESLSYLPGSAFQVAAATLAGQYLGAGDERRAVRGVWSAAAGCMALMGLAGVGFYLASDWLGRQFAPDKPEVAQTAAMLMRIVAFGQAPQALSMVLSGALRGSGDTRGPMVISFIGFLVVRIPLAYWLAWDRIDLHFGPLSASLVGCGLGVRGAWLAMLIDMLLRSLLFAGRFLQGHWKRIEV